MSASIRGGRPRSVAWILLFAFASSSTTAFAQSTKKKPGHAPVASTPTVVAPPPPPPGPPSLSDSLTGDAKSNYDSGKILFVDGDFAGALVKFRSALEKSNDPRLIWNMAACEKNLRHYAAVLTLVRRYLDEGGDRLTDDDRKDARELLTVIEPFTVRVKLDTNEPGADVSIDDTPVGTTPLAKPLIVDIGSRRVRVHKPGFKDYSSTLAVGGAPEIALSVKLDPEVHEGRLRVSTAHENAITIDDRPANGGEAIVLKSGGHRLNVTAAGMRPFQSEIVIADDETRTIDVTLEPVPHPQRVPTWVWITGTTAVIVAGAGIAGYLLLKPKDELAPPVPGSVSPGVVALSFH